MQERLVLDQSPSRTMFDIPDKPRESLRIPMGKIKYS